MDTEQIIELLTEINNAKTTATFAFIIAIAALAVCLIAISIWAIKHEE